MTDEIIHKCEKNVYNKSVWHSFKCGRPAKFEVNGKFFCGMHNPNKPKTKSQIEAEERYQERKDKWQRDSILRTISDGIPTQELSQYKLVKITG